MGGSSKCEDEVSVENPTRFIGTTKHESPGAAWIRALQGFICGLRSHVRGERGWTPGVFWFPLFWTMRCTYRHGACGNRFCWLQSLQRRMLEWALDLLRFQHGSTTGDPWKPGAGSCRLVGLPAYLRGEAKRAAGVLRG